MLTYFLKSILKNNEINFNKLKTNEHWYHKFSRDEFSQIPKQKLTIRLK